MAGRLTVLLRAGEIRAFEYEALHLRYGLGKAFYKADFVVWQNDKSIRLIEVKGRRHDGAIARFRAAAKAHPWFWFEMWSKVNGTWQMIEGHNA